MQLAEKKQFVKELKEDFKNAGSIILTHYQGLNVNGMNTLRSKLRAADCTMKVIKNRLALRAIEESGIESYSAIKEFFKGPTAFLIGSEDPSVAVKVFKEYVDENKLMEFKAAVIKDKFFDNSQIVKIAELPSIDVMIAKTVMVLNAPIQGLYNSCAGIIRKFCYALNDLKDKIEKIEIKQEEPQKEEVMEETKAGTKEEGKTAENNSETEKTGSDNNIEQAKEIKDKNRGKSEKQEG